jgi:hypothetical protein
MSKRRSTYVELVIQIERDVATLNDLSIPEQAQILRSKYDYPSCAWVRELYTRRTYHRAINEVLGISSAIRKRKQDRAAVLYVPASKETA